MSLDIDAPIIEPYLQGPNQEMTGAPGAQNVTQPTDGQRPPPAIAPLAKKLTPPSGEQRQNLEPLRGNAAGSSSSRLGDAGTSTGRSEPSSTRPLVTPRLLPTNLVPEDVTDEPPETIVSSPSRTRGRSSRPISQARRSRAASPSAHSTGRSSRSAASVDRLADAVANRLMQRFAAPSSGEEVSPPSYDNIHDSP